MTANLPKLPIIALVSQQRSGTNVFRHMLRSSGDLHDLGDIFHGHVHNESNFWGFLAGLVEEQPQFSCPHFWFQAWEAYLQEQYSKFGHRRFILDLKIDYFRYILTQNTPFTFN